MTGLFFIMSKTFSSQFKSKIQPNSGNPEFKSDRAYHLGPRDRPRDRESTGSTRFNNTSFSQKFVPKPTFTPKSKFTPKSESKSAPEPEPEVVFPEPIMTSRYLPGWKTSANDPKIIYKSKGFIKSTDVNKYKEEKSSKKLNYWNQYKDPRFTPWQLKFAKNVHDGKNVILNIATSCGKTWSTILTISYETLMDDTATAIFVSPNAEVLRENIEDIQINNDKKYISSGRRMVDTQSRSFCTHDSTKSPISQIMCLTAQNFADFVTSELNHRFINNLKFIVFDEIHLTEVSNSLYWSQYIPHTAKYMLLSATLGNTEKAQNTLREIAYGAISLITYNIRPIPLQRVLFKGCPLPINGIKCNTLKSSGRLSCQINPFDPTMRDILSYCKTNKINPKTIGDISDRQVQYDFGGSTILPNIESVSKLIDADLECAVCDPTPENLFKLLSYIFSNSMQPALVFNTSAAQTRYMAENLVSYIAELESNDPEYKRAKKFSDKQEKKYKKERDLEVKQSQIRSRSASTSRINKKINSINKGSNLPDEDESKVDHSILLNLNKWKFPKFNMEFESFRGIPHWVQNCLEYGIGVYTQTFPKWLKYKIFDAYKEGKIQVLISDVSLSIGINLPARTCILCGDINPTLYRQMGGRSGRRGFDTRGFVIPMFEKESIKKCILSNENPVTITMPKSLTICDLIRLTTPLFLELYTTRTEIVAKKTRRKIKHITKKKKEIISLTKRQKFDVTLKKIILKNYEDSLNERQLVNHKKIMDYIIKKQKWNTHRLTNIIKRLDYNESLIFMQMFVNGDLKDIDFNDMLNIISTLFEREEITDSDELKSDPAQASELHSIIVKYGSSLSGEIDFSKPINDYFTRFCKTGEYDIQYLDRITKIGNWIYVMKKYCAEIAPKSDRFIQMINKVDNLYLAACKRNCL